jgi:DNA polymerase-1
MPADRARLETILAEVTLQIEGREEALRQYLGERVNLESPRQLLHSFEALGCRLNDTSEDTLVTVSHPVARRLLDYRESLKVKQQAQSLLESIGPDGMIHAEFRAREDLHRATGAILLDKAREVITKEERQIAKSVAFGLAYGAGAQGLRNYAKATYAIDLNTRRAQQIRNKFFEHYSGLREWHRKAHAKSERVTQGRTVTGRRRLLHTSMNGDSNDINWNAFQLQTNFPVQGSAADVLKSAMIKVAERIPAGAKLRACVHDELILSARREIAEDTFKVARQAMAEAFSELFPEVPIEVEGKVCQHWGQK